ncbi:Pyruvate decarboxylase 1 [Recurvomyces mirabilis]|uniref:Pyruvate decarboxylase n=1 Tax=Recurvomyces mirabilis TaxID=574656 RepID=A0AAE0WXV3_9PEZI|nr:Pyruvate decarboxylase 1 [Recurvomyces mirabilis]KAK5162006.1 Pyruvate decarboxylase 1 [Recurvomyces mirabilis]
MSHLKISDYLFQRLAQLGIKTVFGVPGDYELALLDLIGDAGVKFSGSANELIASNAADGYSRINGAGAFVTTFGPGELSGYCGHAGAYAEFVPVVHVVGYPGVEAMREGRLMHHSLGDGRFGVYHEMAIILADGNIVRNHLTAEADKLAELTRWPYFTTCMGKGGVNEELPNYAGVYAGGGSIPEIRKAIEDDSDLVLWLGSYRTDFNTGEMTDFVDGKKIVDLQRFFTKIAGENFKVGMHSVLPALIAQVKQDSSVVKKESVKVSWDPYPAPAGQPDSSAALTQDYLWATLPHLFQPGDLIIGETGTSAFGLAASRYPAGCKGYNQTVWGSIGYAGPSAVGSFLAAHEAGTLNRGILVTGEGSLQLTPMAFAEFLMLGLKPIVFVLKNGGYTVERLIHGKDAFYNAVPKWDYKQLSTVFGVGMESKYYGPIGTCGDFEALVRSKDFRDGNCFQLVELILGEMDAPASVGLSAAAIEAFNQKHAPKEAGANLGG